MTELQSPSSKSACNKREAEVCQPPIASNRWSLADRDELGEMREGMNPGLLVSQDFLTDLWAAFQQMHKHLEPPGEYCQSIMRRAGAQRQEDIVVNLSHAFPGNVPLLWCAL
jgi:hypothetical protein